MTLITVFGGTAFLGRRIVERLTSWTPPVRPGRPGQASQSGSPSPQR